MANKANFGWDGLKKTVSRTKYQVLSKVGKADQTTDAQFSQEKEKFDERFKMMKKLETSISKYTKALKELSLAHIELTENIHQVYEGHCKLYNANVVNQRITGTIDAVRTNVEDIYRDNVLVCLNEHMAQWRTLEKRITERQRRRVDMDRYATEVTTMEKKGDSPKLQQAREKQEAMTVGYNELNEELIQDMVNLVEDRYAFFDPLFAMIIDGQITYYKKAHEAYHEMEPLIKDVDRTAYLRHPVVITPEENSCYRKTLQQYIDEVIAGGNVPTNPYAPSSTPSAAGSSQLRESYSAAPPSSASYGAVPPSGAAYGAVPPSAAAYGAAPPPGGAYGSVPPSGPGYGAPPPSGAAYGAVPAYGGVPPSSSTGSYAGAPYGGPGASGGRGTPSAGPPPYGHPSAAPYGGVPAASSGPPSGNYGGAPYGGPGAGGRGTPLPQPPTPYRPPPPSPTVIKARALYPFSPSEANELAFNAGDTLIITNKSGDWWEAELNGRRGLIPANYVQLI